MGVINQLSVDVSNKIAAGEVVERPASVVKELVENSIDAGATVILVEIKNGGVSFLRITDNGSGMSREDAEMCFLRHATSKIKTADDLDRIMTFGFRGEALSSVCAVSRTELFTKRAEDDMGTYIKAEYGKTEASDSQPTADGTTFVVRDLFKNVPARLKFLKKDATEAGYISDIMVRFILAHPEISFRLIKDDKEQFFTPGDSDIKNAVYSVYGRDYAKAVSEVDYEYNAIRVSGVIGKSETARANRSYQSFFINGRYIKSAMLTKAAEEAYKGQIMIGKFPMFALNIEIDPSLIDINVHPTKLEAKFSNEQDVYRAVYHAVKNELYKVAYVPEIERVKDEEIKPAAEELYEKKPEEPGWKQAPMPSQRGAFSQYEKKPAVKNTPDAFRLNIPEAATANDRWAGFNIKAAGGGESIKEATPAIIPKEKEVITDNTTETVKAEVIPAMEYNVKKPMILEQPDILEADICPIKVIGQLFKTYILAEEGDSLIIVDQHAAHERVMYERVKEQLAERRIYSQQMLIPIGVDMTDCEKQVCLENKDKLDEMGFEFKITDNGCDILSAPDTMNEDVLINVFLELVTAFIEGRQEIMDEAKDRLIKTIACKAAIKANRETGMEEMKELIRQVKRLEVLNTCPHGRPIIIRMTKKELEKEFGRTL